MIEIQKKVWENVIKDMHAMELEENQRNITGIMVAVCNIQLNRLDGQNSLAVEGGWLIMATNFNGE